MGTFSWIGDTRIGERGQILHPAVGDQDCAKTTSDTTSMILSISEIKVIHGK